MDKKMKKIMGILQMLQFGISVSVVIILMAIFPNNTKNIRRKWAILQKYLLGFDIELIGQIDKNANMLLLNHQSLLDIIIFEYLDDRDIAWVAKKEIGDLPWFGKILKYTKMIEVERENKKSLIKLLKDVKDRLKHNRPIAIFPEGTRSNGDKILKFKSGAKLIAQKFNLKVQPVVIIGSINILDSKKLLAQRGKVKVICLDSIQVNKADENWYKDIENKMKNTFKSYKHKDNM
jgi:1-acyl-sn-glycerol-3-phosphate acyltransferase